MAVPPDTPPDSNTGNRYTLERAYQGEISAAESYLRSVLDMGDPLVILDVRDETEHELGHPEFSYNTPFPRIYRDCVDDERTEDGACAIGTAPGSTVSQTPAGLFAEVESLGLDQDTPIATLCRTGFRSVLAANILSDPQTYICDPSDASCLEDYEGRGFTNVRNIWEGFVGQPIAPIQIIDGTRYLVGSDAFKLPKKDDPDNRYRMVGQDLDLNNDGEVSAVDKDGWRYHQNLPWVTSP